MNHTPAPRTKVTSKRGLRGLGHGSILAVLLAAGCADPDAEIESITSALTSWNFFNNAGNFTSDNPGGLDVGEGIACKVVPYPDPRPPNPYRTDMAVCFLAPDLNDAGEGQRVNWSFRDVNGYPSVPGGGIKSISVSAPIAQNAAVYMLGNDNKVRIATGSTAVPWFTAGNFDTVRDYISNVSDSGISLCLKQISTIVLPSRYGPSRALVALDCAGNVYVKGINSQNQWVWKTAASSGAPWNGTPRGTWLEISHGPVGAYLLARDNTVALMATGTANIDGSVTWASPQWLPRTGLISALTIKHVGGPFVLGDVAGDSCTSLACAFDSLRVYRWSGTQYVRKPGIQPSSTSGSNPWGYIVDSSAYQRKPDAYALLNINAWRMYMVTPQ
jgi:hypothetical protein